MNPHNTKSHKIIYRKKFKKYAGIMGAGLCSGLLFSGCVQQSEKLAEDKPNILFIMTDDQGPWTLSVEGYPNTNTPNLDILANQGVLFSNAFASSAVCSPARAALISGRYPSETGILDFIPGNEPGMDTSLVLWPEVFQEAGYKTAMVGKWHIGATEVYHPENRGYDKFSGWLHGALRSKDPVVRVEGRDTTFKDQYTPDVITDLAINYIKEFKDEPWLISLHYWAPHANTEFPEGYSPPYDDRSWLPMRDEDLAYWKDLDLELPEPDFPNLDTKRVKRMMREYYASVHSVDRNVGRIMRLLDYMDLDKNTIVIFTSDHGYMMGHHGLWHKGNGRWLTIDGTDPDGIFPNNRPNMYDLSLRVPFIVRWPGYVEAGKSFERTITFLDIYPTLLEMAGIEKPVDIILRGNSFWPLLKGVEEEWSDIFYAQYKTLRSIQTLEWKYVYHSEDTTKNELYYLAKDPDEHINLIKSNFAEKEAELKSLLLNKMREINDPLFN